MKRTNLVLDEDLLKTATRLLGAKTYSEAVNRSLAEAIRIGKIRGLFSLMGQVEWAGDLSEMRRDGLKRRPGKKHLR